MVRKYMTLLRVVTYACSVCCCSFGRGRWCQGRFQGAGYGVQDAGCELQVLQVADAFFESTPKTIDDNLTSSSKSHQYLREVKFSHKSQIALPHERKQAEMSPFFQGGIVCPQASTDITTRVEASRDASPLRGRGAGGEAHERSEHLLYNDVGKLHLFVGPRSGLEEGQRRSRAAKGAGGEAYEVGFFPCHQPIICTRARAQILLRRIPPTATAPTRHPPGYPPTTAPYATTKTIRYPSWWAPRYHYNWLQLTPFPVPTSPATPPIFGCRPTPSPPRSTTPPKTVCGSISKPRKSTFTVTPP